MDRDGQGRDESRPYEDESRPPPRMSRSAKGDANHRDGRGRDPPRSDGLGEASRRGRPDDGGAMNRARTNGSSRRSRFSCCNGDDGDDPRGPAGRRGMPMVIGFLLSRRITALHTSIERSSIIVRLLDHQNILLSMLDCKRTASICLAWWTHPDQQAGAALSAHQHKTNYMLG
jgi:hypothetical protein